MHHLKFFLAVILILSGLSCSENDLQQSSGAERPNIIVIMSDDVGYSDIGCYGGEINTPNLDRLAANGLRFSQFYNVARCCPTRASLLTGLYPHQAGVGHMMNDRGTPAFQGDLNRHCQTIAEVLKTAGYQTYMSGKWHVTPVAPTLEQPDKHNWPLNRGFDKFFGTIHGAGSFYDPRTLASGNDYLIPGEGFYYTDAISDSATHYIEQHDTEDPFFMYVAYTAAHWPLHALPKDIEKYQGRYDEGWNAIREERYQRMKDMGLIETNWPLTQIDPRGDWQGLSDEDKQFHARCMEVYAAMLDNMDQGIGRILKALERKNKLDNTLILYLQDNGACAEAYGLGRTYEPDPDQELQPMDPDELQPDMEPRYTRDGKPVRVGFGVMPGPADTYIGYAPNWANASNTPFREYKHWVHEGGIASPLIAHWPDGIDGKDFWNHTPAHLIDIMATCVDLAGAAYPDSVDGMKITALEGVSLAPAFVRQDFSRVEPLCWEHEGNRAVRQGKWKLVSRADWWPFVHDTTSVLPTDMWELYDMDADRTETNNVAKEHPERVASMAAAWLTWADRVGALPRPGPGRERPNWVKALQTRHPKPYAEP